MKNLIRIIILVIVCFILLDSVANAQLLKDGFVDTHKTIDDDDILLVDYSFRDFGIVYFYKDNPDEIKLYYYKILIFIGSDIVEFHLDSNKHGKYHYYKLSPNYREKQLSLLINHPVDSVQHLNIDHKKDFAYIPDDPNFFGEFYEKHFGSDLMNVITGGDPDYFEKVNEYRFSEEARELWFDEK